MKIELTEANVDNGIHMHPELWVRVLSNEPLGPQAWDQRIKPMVDGETLKAYRTAQCSFMADIWDEDDPERQEWGFEQWYILPAIAG